MSASSPRLPDLAEDPAFLEFERSLNFPPAFDKQDIQAATARSESTIDRWTRTGELRAFRLGGKLTFLSRDVALLLYRNLVRDATPLSEAKPLKKSVPPPPEVAVEARRQKMRGRRRTNPTSRVAERT
jgi:hypothetical protein